MEAHKLRAAAEHKLLEVRAKAVVLMEAYLLAAEVKMGPIPLMLEEQEVRQEVLEAADLTKAVVVEVEVVLAGMAVVAVIGQLAMEEMLPVVALVLLMEPIFSHL
jgi:hypothetical protein